MPQNNPLIILSNITNLGDARFAAAEGIQYIGFCFDPESSNYIPPVKAKEIMDWVSGVKTIAGFGKQSIESITEISTLLEADAMEFENDFLPDALQQAGLPVFKKINTDTFTPQQLQKELDSYAPFAKAFHLYSASCGQPDYAFVKSLCENYPVIWGYELNKENANTVLQHINPYAINLSGTNEEKTGLKDFDGLSELLELLNY